MITNNTVTLTVRCIIDDVIRCHDGTGEVHLIPLRWWQGPSLNSLKLLEEGQQFHITLMIGMVLDDHIVLQELDDQQYRRSLGMTE